MTQATDSLKTCKDSYIQALVDIGIERDEAICEAQIVLTTLTGLSIHQLLTGYEQPIGPLSKEFERVLSERLRRVPLQYVLGHTYFMGLKFFVEPGCLIPRPETEHLVEEVLAYIETQKIAQPKILEVGPGSGCICVSILKKCPTAEATVLEVSSEALAITIKNAREHGVESRLTAIKADFLSLIAQEAAAKAILDGVDILVSNPPYITPADMESLAPEVKEHEPLLALAGPDADGMGFYRAFAGILGGCGHWPVNRTVALVVEVGYDQGEAVSKLFAASGLKQIRRIKDLSGIERVVFAIATASI